MAVHGLVAEHNAVGSGSEMEREAVWSNLPVPKKNGAELNVHIQAIFEQKPEAGVDAGQGKITSPEVAIRFSNLR